MASYPSSVKSFTTKAINDVIQPADPNDLQDEVTALETGLLNGLAHDAIPDATANNRNVGSTAKKWKDAHFAGDVEIHGVAYVWPGADGAANQVLKTDGAKNLSWATVGGDPVNVCDFRLTLETGVAFSTTDQTAKTTVYCTPYRGNRVALYDGSAWNIRTSAEISIAVPATTNQMYDVFVYDNAGTATLEVTAWTNDTTRATALTTQDGVLVKTGATTRRYLGSFRTTGVSGQTEDSVTKRFVWSYYNRTRRTVVKQSGDASWTYASTTIQQANANAANKVEIVVGVAEDPLELAIDIQSAATAGAPVTAVGVGVDSTTAFSGLPAVITSNTSGYVQMHATYRAIPSVGYHAYNWNERSTTGNTSSFQNTLSGVTGPGLHGWVNG